MWTVDHKDFLLLRDGGGEPFTALVDALLRAHGFVHGVGEADILTCLRTNIADGGVDTEVQRAMPGDPTGFVLEPTCWQYKSKSYADISDADLLKEIEKPYVAELIKRGYAYRFAICDDMPPEKQTAWEEILTDRARQINPQAPAARVVTTSKLASWVNRYPALLPAHFGYDSGPVLYFGAWSRNITKVTQTFVPLEAWKGVAELIENHTDLARPAIQATLPLQGLAGVGKTRLVYEVIANRHGAQHLVLYTADGDDAENVARSLAREPRTTCILVADECPAVARVNIGNSLKGHTDRVRVVCIDNSGERPMGGEEELYLEELAPASVEKVLAENFPFVPVDRRRAYSELSGGYIRFAADMCEHHTDIERKGHLGPALATIQEYYLARLPGEEERRAIEAIALVQKVGFGQGVSDELDALCDLTTQTPQQVLETAAALKDAPGFIVRTTRYLYITPEIVARVAFANAWRRWIEADPEAFLRKLPAILLDSFQARVARSASPEVRTRTGAYFFGSVASLKISDLKNKTTMDRFATLINTDPDVYFPRLTVLVREASLDELRQIDGQFGGRGSRRTLVWTAEHLAGFPKYFWQSEEILRRLALAETEARIGNNATGVWKELFRIQLSGAATPFSERMELLERSIFSADDGESSLALQALLETLNLTGTRMVGPSAVAGQLVPPDWHPSSFEEFQNCLELILALFNRVFDRGTSELRQKAWPGLARHIRSLISHGMLSKLRAIVERRPIPDVCLPDVLESLEDFLQYECGGESGVEANGPYCRDAAEWLLQLTPSDFTGRLKAVVGKDPWHHSRREEVSGIPSEIISVAEELNRDPAGFETVLPYLNSLDAASAGLLGEALARLDAGGRYMDDILSSAAKSGSNALARGYTGRLPTTYPETAERLDTWLNVLENEAPELAYFVSLTTPEFGRPLERTLRLIGHGKLHIHSLQNFVVGVLLDRMSSNDLSTVLDLLVQARDPQSLHIAIDFVGHSVQKGRKSDSTERDAMWRALEASAPVEDRGGYWWARAVETFAPESPERACRVAILGLAGEDYDKRNHAWSILGSVAKTQPDLVMDSVGKMLLDQEHGWRLRIGARSGLFQALPLESVQRWLTETGIEGARVIANHLQPPSIDGKGKPRIHPLTEYVLRTWGEDESVFGRFAASTHHLQWYSGNIAEMHQMDADRAKPFLTHAIPAVRKWAEYEVQLGERHARDWKTTIEEDHL